MWSSPNEPMRHLPVEELLRVLDDLLLLGVAREPLYQAGGVSAQVAETESTRIPIDAFVALFAHAERLTGDPLVGLHAAEHTTFNHLVAFLAASEATLADAWAQLCRFQALLLGAEGLSIRAGRSTIRLRLSRGGVPDALRHVTEYYLATLARECVALAGPAARPLEVHFSHAPGGSTAAAERVFACPVRFRTEETMLCISRQAAEAPLASADAYVARALAELAAEQLERLGRESLRERVAHAIRVAMASTGRADCGRIARQLAMSVRTLQRRLGEEDLTFRGLRDAVRRDLAIELNSGAAVPWRAPTVTDLAMSVGFSDSATLCRAFKRWTGVSPGVYRGGRLAEAGRAAAVSPSAEVQG